MFAIHCNHCQKHYLVGTSQIVSFGNTDQGPEAVVRCPKGHAVLHDFHTEVSRDVEPEMVAA
jgi:hypothetical protein